MGKINVAKLLGVGAGVALGTYLTRQYLRKYQALKGNYSPLIDQVLVIILMIMSIQRRSSRSSLIAMTW